MNATKKDNDIDEFKAKVDFVDFPIVFLNEVYSKHEEQIEWVVLDSVDEIIRKNIRSGDMVLIRLEAGEPKLIKVLLDYREKDKIYKSALAT